MSVRTFTLPGRTELPKAALVSSITVAFVALTPLCTFLLLALHGIPNFARSEIGAMLGWVYQVCWTPALLAGLLLSASIVGLTARTSYFHHPYDFGRCFSLGAIAGAIAEAGSTWLYRLLSHRPFSAFWIAGATIAGSIIGGLVVSLSLLLLVKRRR